MPEPKPKPEPEAVPKTEGGVKSTETPAPESTGMITEGGETPAPRDGERPGGMIGEG